jgi:hypothetical protein
MLKLVKSTLCHVSALYTNAITANTIHATMNHPIMFHGFMAVAISTLGLT